MLRFDSLRRWRPGPWSESGQPIEKTLEAMDAAGVTRGMRRGWDLGSSPAPVVGPGSRDLLEPGTSEPVGRAYGVGVCVHQLHDAGAGDLGVRGGPKPLRYSSTV